MQGNRLDHPRRAGEAGVRADVDLHRTGADEAIHQVLGQGEVDLVHRQRRPLGAASERVVDVHVEAVLVGRVPDRAERRAEVAAVRPAQIADADPGCAGMGGRVGVDHAQRGAHEVVGSPAPPGPVGRAPADRVPGEVVGALGGQPDAPDQPAGVGEAERLRAAPVDRAPGAAGRVAFVCRAPIRPSMRSPPPCRWPLPAAASPRPPPAEPSGCDRPQQSRAAATSAATAAASAARMPSGGA